MAKKILISVILLIAYSQLAICNISIDHTSIQTNEFNNSKFFSDEGNYDNTNNNENYSSGTDPFDVKDTPINDYLPLLAVAAVGLGFYYRKELNQTIKSN